jgi:hypothetical protein
MGRRVVATLIDGVIVLAPVTAYEFSELSYVTTDDLAASNESVTQFCDRYDDTHSSGFCYASEGIDRAYYGNPDSGPQLVYTGLLLLMFVFLQGVAGWTVGKLIVGIRCVREDGAPPGVLKAFLRWVFWLVDGLPFVIPALVGFIVGLTTVGHRRVGDMVAKTFVVRKQAAGQPVVVPGLNAPPLEAAWGTDGATGYAPAPTAKHGPQWDEARGTYIQWDPAQSAWMQWDEAGRAWHPIPVPTPGDDDIPPPPPVAPPG